MHSHFEIAMCSKSRMIVATGSSGASAVRRWRSRFGCLICFKPAGTVSKILIGYLFLPILRWRQYSQAARVRTMMTKALRRTLRKKKRRAKETVTSCSDIAKFETRTYNGEGTSDLPRYKHSVWHKGPQVLSSPRLHQVSYSEGPSAC